MTKDLKTEVKSTPERSCLLDIFQQINSAHVWQTKHDIENKTSCTTRKREHNSPTQTYMRIDRT